MNDPVERDDVIKVIDKRICELQNHPTFKRKNADRDLYGLKKMIINLSPARPQGKWLPIIEANEFGEAYQAGIYCSECGETLGCEANFCPNCGADMRGADDV